MIKEGAVIKAKKHMKPMAFLRRYGRIMIGGIIIGVILVVAIFAPFIMTDDPFLIDLSQAKQLPGPEHFFGTDLFGRDLFSRIVYGSRATLLVTVGVQVITVVIGTVLGLLCGYYTKVEKILMRILEGVNTIPSLLLALVMASVLGPGTFKLMLALSISAIPNIARMIRSQVLSLREKEFIESEKGMGAGDMRTIFLHILPSCSSYLLVRFSSGLASTVLSMTSLSYLGVGMDPNLPSWGGIISDGQGIMLAYPHLVVYAGMAICIIVFGFSILGDGLRDLLDPKLK